MLRFLISMVIPVTSGNGHLLNRNNIFNAPHNVMSLQIDDFSELNEEKNTHMKGFITGGTWKLKEDLY